MLHLYKTWRLLLVVWMLILAQVHEEAFSFSPRGRETREQRQENTNRLRDMLSYLYRASALASSAAVLNDSADSRWERVGSQLDNAIGIWPKIEHRLSPARAASVTARLEQAKIVSAEKKGFLLLVTNLDELIGSLLESFQVITTPAQTPEFELGERVFKTTCASCHGMQGRADGILAANLKPPPISFFDRGYHASLSAFSVINLLLGGVEGQAKNSFEHLLTPHEMWSVAFYVISLPHLESELEKELVDPSWFSDHGGSLRLLASLNGRQLLSWLSLQLEGAEGETLSLEGQFTYLRTRGVYAGGIVRSR